MLVHDVAVPMFVTGLVALNPVGALSQEFPSKPIRIVTTGAGSGNDFNARLIAQGLTESFGQPVIVENRSGTLPGEVVSKASPDGYTLLASGGTLWIEPLLRKTPYDPLRDVAPVTLVASSPNVLVIHPSVPAKSVKEWG